MLRRSRISVRPNVKPAGRGPAPVSSQDTPPPPQEVPAAGSQASEDSPLAGSQGVDDSTATGVEESSAPREDGKDLNAETSSGTTSVSLQRRKRFSVMPNLAKPRAAATPALTRSAPRAPKSPGKAVSEAPTPAPKAPEAPSQPDSGPSQGMRSPRRRPSGGGRPAKSQTKPSSLSSASPGPETPLEKETVKISSPSELVTQAVDDQTTSPQVTEQDRGFVQSDLPKKPPKATSAPLEKVKSSSLPDREGVSVSERAKTLAARSVQGGFTGLAPGKTRLSRFVNDPTDLQRLAKARKLRELLRQEMNKEKKRSKAQVCVKEYNLDPTKMTMRDLIYYLPETNPMTSYLEEDQGDNETVLPLTPPREQSPEKPPTPKALAEVDTQRDEDEREDDDADGGVLVPRVKVAEDGSLIIDEESLTVEVLRQKGPNPADDRDPIFERGSTTTYSSFRKGTHVKPWSNKETDMFFLAISMVGTDFSMIGQLFPHRGRTEIKNKFKKEEKANSWRVDKAFKEKRRLDVAFFSSLLEKILAVQSKKKNKCPTENKVMKKKTQTKEKKAGKQLSDVEEEGSDLEVVGEGVGEGEKENEDISNEGAPPAPNPPKRKRKRTAGAESSPDKAKGRKKKKSKLIISDEEETGLPEESDAGVPEGQVPEDDSTAHSLKQAEEPVEGAKGLGVIKPAKLSRGQPQRPPLNLGRKGGKCGPGPTAKPSNKEGASHVEEITEQGLPIEQVNEDASKPKSEKKKACELSSSDEEEEANDKPVKPTRYGRIPKKTKFMNFPGNEDGNLTSDSPAAPVMDESPSTSSSTNPKAKPPTRRAKIKPGPALPGRKGQLAAMKSKLVTLRASQSEDDDDDDEGSGGQREEALIEEDLHTLTYPEEQNQAPAFVPMSLRSPQPIITEVEETMEEFDISVNVPDVLGISHDAFCPDSSCERGQGGEVGTVPCEHQLDLLVDVIDFLSPDNMDVSEESYNDAARTLLAIGNLSYVSQAETSTGAAEDFITEECSNKDQLLQVVTEASQTAEDTVPVAPATSPIAVTTTSKTASPPVTTTTASPPVTTTTASPPVTTTTASPPVTTTTASPPVTTTTASPPVTTTTASPPVTTTTASPPVTTTTASPPVTTTTASPPVTTTTASPPVTTTTASPPVTTTTASPPVTTTTASPPVTTTTASPLVTTTTASPLVTTTTASPLVTTTTAFVPVSQISGMPPVEALPKEETLQQGEFCSEEAEVSEKPLSPKTRRSRFPKVKPNLCRTARSTQPKRKLSTENTSPQAESPKPEEDTTLQPKPQPGEIITIKPELPQPPKHSTESHTIQPELPQPPKNTTESHTVQPEFPQPPQNTTESHTVQPELPQTPQNNTEGHTIQPELPQAVDDTTTQPEQLQPRENIKILPKTHQTSTTLSDPPPAVNVTREATPPTNNLTRQSEGQTRLRTTSHSKMQPTTNNIPHSEPLPIQRTRIARSKRQSSLNEPTPPTLNSPTNKCPKPQSTESTTILPESGPSPEQNSPGTCRTRAPDPEFSLQSSEDVKGDSDVKEITSSSLSAEGSLSGTSDPKQPKQTGPPTRRARLPKPKPNLGHPTRGTTRSAAQVSESSNKPDVQTPSVEATSPCQEVQTPSVEATSPCQEVQRQETVQTPEKADVVSMDIQQIHHVIPFSDIIDTTQGNTSVFTEEHFFTPQSVAVNTQNSESLVSSVVFNLDQDQQDPDEPIFILSLTEIPVHPTGEEYTLSEAFSFQPAEGACIQLQQSDSVAPGGGLGKGDAGVLHSVPESVPVDLIVPQPSHTPVSEAECDSTASPEGVGVSANPSGDPTAGAESDEDVAPPTEKTEVPERARRGKLLVRPTCPRRLTRSAVTEEAVSNLPPGRAPSADHPPASPQPSVTRPALGDAGADESQQRVLGHLNLPETEDAGGKDRSLGAEIQAAQSITPLVTTSPLSRPGRRPRGFLSFMSNKPLTPASSAPARGPRAAAQRPQVNTNRTGGKRADSAPSSVRAMPARFTSPTRTTIKPDGSPTVTWGKPSDVQTTKSDPEPSTSQGTASQPSQGPDGQPSASPCVDSYSTDEEPINVSQYFFSDIFTEVEENEG
ncbi:mucin-5AC isoform X2 [Esox lucius]|uniref:mucin-5AC isoform X2 n=1 Tax=Esox lucius TaxID=8010 RepID=UPI001476CBED|nr:mucin-5AC isoform X2 [Esox lucius]